LQLIPTCLKVTKPRKSIASRLKITIVYAVTCFLLVSPILVLYWKRKSKLKPSSIVSKIDLLPTISYNMLHQATNEFSLNNLNESGSFGTVYKGVLDLKERSVAPSIGISRYSVHLNSYLIGISSYERVLIMCICDTHYANCNFQTWTLY
jgi:hypothetical protein